VDLLDPEPANQVRSALSEVQMLYAKEAGGDAPAADSPPSPPASGLWTPGSE
jgi:hypothetical protein